jgi:competence protein ComEC
MKVPAVAIVAIFACGIVLGLYFPGVLPYHSRAFLALCFSAAALLIIAGIFLTALGKLSFAAIISLASWISLGVLGGTLSVEPRPANHVLTLIETGRVDLQTPLRWHGRLHDEPSRLPWGYSYEVELSSVEYRGETLATQGGLRLNFAPQDAVQAVPDLHAGDTLAVVAQARRPQVYKDAGAFDRRAYLEQQNIHLLATLRAAELLGRESSQPLALGSVLPRARHLLRVELDTLFQQTPQVAGVLRAMLLGDRSFVDRDEATDFQKTGVFHVLVVAGVHVGALAAFIFVLARKLRLSLAWSMLFTFFLLFAYVALVERRPPVLRAAIMAAIVVLGGFFYRRLDLLNSAALAALILLVAKPSAIRDSSFQLTFVAIGCIAGLAVPWLDQTTQPYVRALRGWRDVTRDASHEPKQAQFRIDLRGLAHWVSGKLPLSLARATENSLAGSLLFSLRVWDLFALTLVLQIGMLPLMACDFHRVTLAGPIVNLTAVPMVGVIVPLGFLTLAGGLLHPAAGKLLAVPLGWLTLALIRIVQWFAHFHQASYRIPAPPAWLTATFFIPLVLLAFPPRSTIVKRWWKWGSIGALLASTLAIVVFPFAPTWSPGKLEVTILDVGQGDSLLVVSPKGKTLLIDGGGSFAGFPGQQAHLGSDPGEEAVSPFLWSRRFQKLDVVALTHAHQDHIGGLNAILQNFRVGALWIGREVTSSSLAKLEQLARERMIPVMHESKGEKFLWDGVAGQFLWPEAPVSDTASNPANNDSLVLRLQYGDRTVLLPGDAEKQAEHEILTGSDTTSLQSDVLKIGHHGSKNSTTPEFLAAIQPRLAVISAGEGNPYGHPSRELLERLERADVRVLRTDRDGAVRILTDGTDLEVSCFVACPQINEGISGRREAQTPNQ